MKSTYIFLTVSVILLSYSCNIGVSQEQIATKVNDQTVTVTYNLNGGKGSLTAQTKGKSEYIILHGSDSLTAPIDKPYFGGWTTKDSKQHYKAGERYSKTESITLYAVWKKKKDTQTEYTITYYKNDKSTPPANPISETKTKDGVYTIKDASALKIQRKGYQLGGWTTKADGQGSTYKLGSSYTAAQSLTLYAEWWKEITSSEEFNKIKNNLSGKYILMNDISFQNKIPETMDCIFTGQLNGNKKTLSGINISSGSNIHGVFSTLSENARIFDLTLKDIKINVTGGDPSYAVGILAGTIEGSAEITRVTIDGGRIEIGRGRTGGLVGYMTGGTINECQIGTTKIGTTAKVVTIKLGDGYAGGLVGIMGGGLIRDTKEINVDLSEGDKSLPASSLGAFVGLMTGGQIIQNNPCTVTSTVPAGDSYAIGAAQGGARYPIGWKIGASVQTTNGAP